MATADLTVIGLGHAEPSASRYIAEIQRRLAAQVRVRPEQMLDGKVSAVEDPLDEPGR